MEKFWDWTDSAGPPENVISRDRLLDNVMLYWLPNTGASSARLYWESFAKRRMDPVEVPTGVTLFPRELWRLPRAWIEQRYTDLRHWSEPTTGGHFASLEQPEVFVDELRTFFRPLRCPPPTPDVIRRQPDAPSVGRCGGQRAQGGSRRHSA